VTIIALWFCIGGVTMAGTPGRWIPSRFILPTEMSETIGVYLWQGIILTPTRVYHNLRFMLDQQCGYIVCISCLP